MKVKYVVVHYSKEDIGAAWLVGIDSNEPMGPGWYLKILDDDGRQAFYGKACETAELALLQRAAETV